MEEADAPALSTRAKLVLQTNDTQQRSNRKQPDRDDGAERGEAADGPAGGIGLLLLARDGWRFDANHLGSPIHGRSPKALFLQEKSTDTTTASSLCI